MESADELRRLRARAYGPNADIADDPVALARLDELETARRTTATPADAVGEKPPVETVEGDAPPRALPFDEPSNETTPADADPAPLPAGERPVPAPARGWRGWSRRRTAVVGAIALVVVVVVAVGATAFVVRRSGYSAPVDAVLAPTPGREMPSIFGMANEDTVVYADFAGFTPASGELAWNSSVPTQCLMIVEAEHIESATPNSFSGAVHSGCGAGPFPATISLVVGPESPPAMREIYPEGTAVQFVLEDGEVVVLTAPPESDPERSGDPAPA